ncbi:DUF2946 domain-containing protein [Marinobacter fonticola]|uniref:DUF2946 domain-containing protein n=1 Tax=Marinobacter fonticola TaxID=2603215 RepID=UPI00143CC8EF|nr:DUF2946 domain-containing protein [Marinobacter fonticola]
MRYAAWLALVSMLLIFVGPLYSNSQALLSAQTHPDPPPGFDPHAEGAYCGEIPATGQDVQQAPAHSPMLHAECGYCILLSHTPPPAPTSLDAVTPPFWSAPLPLPAQEATYSFRPYGIAQVRAPPSIIV